MSTSNIPIEEEYLEGLYRDMAYGDIVSYEYDDESDQLILNDPDGNEQARIAPSEFDPNDVVTVPREAINDPVRFYANLIAYFIEVDRMGNRDFAGYEYVTDHTAIVPTETVPLLGYIRNQLKMACMDNKVTEYADSQLGLAAEHVDRALADIEENLAHEE